MFPGLSREGGPDWRVWLGISITIAWLILGAIYVSHNIGWMNFGDLPADELGSFLEGAFAPLAFLWLVIGYFIQQKELEQNTAALVIQSQKMAESEVHQRQDTFLQIVKTVRGQLGSISGFLYISVHGVGGDGAVTPEEVGRLFTLQSSEEPEVFSRRLMERHFQLNDPQREFDMFYGTPIRARHSNNFIFTFERLMRRAEAVDPENIIRDSLMASGHGFLYTIIKRFQAKAPPELADHTKTGAYIDI